jgi:hypothetical protein
MTSLTNYCKVTAALLSLLWSSTWAQTAICTPGPCAQEATLTQILATVRSTVAQEATLREAVTTLQSQLQLLQTQLTPVGGAPAGTLPAYQMALTLPTITCAPLGPVAANIPASVAVTTVCTDLTTAFTEFMTAQQTFNAGLQTMSTQFTTLATPANNTVAGILGNSLQVQVLQGQQTNLIAKHMANLRWLERRLDQAEAKLTNARAKFMFGGL